MHFFLPAKQTIACAVEFIGSGEQYGFLQDRLIHDVVATTQECLYSIHTNKLEVIIMKVDLKKTYDCVDWTFLYIILHRVGLEMQNIE